MFKIREFAAMLAILVIPLSISGCYTIIGYPEESIVAEELPETGAYGYYDEYYYDLPYRYWYDYDLWYYRHPYYYYGYWYSPWWYDDYYWRDYYYTPTPEKKPDIRKRDASEPRRSPSIEQRERYPLKENDKEEDQPSEKRPDKSQRSAGKLRSSRSEEDSRDE